MVKIGAHNGTLTVTGAVGMVIDPTTNVGGVIVQTGYLWSPATGSSKLYVDTASPSSHSDVSRKSVSRATDSENMPIPCPLYLPPGYGAWVAVTTGATGGAVLTYDFLS